jgi:hypothetical protein
LYLSSYGCARRVFEEEAQKIKELEEKIRQMGARARGLG